MPAIDAALADCPKDCAAHRKTAGHELAWSRGKVYVIAAILRAWRCRERKHPMMWCCSHAEALHCREVWILKTPCCEDSNFATRLDLPGISGSLEPLTASLKRPIKSSRLRMPQPYLFVKGLRSSIRSISSVLSVLQSRMFCRRASLVATASQSPLSCHRRRERTPAEAVGSISAAMPTA
jgi:hypothetical protein